MEKSKKELLGLKIKEYRENRKFTQDKLAEMVGIDPKHLSRIENGRNYPSLDTLEKILDSLNVSYEEIFNFKLLVPKDELIKMINTRLENLDETGLKLVYNIVNEL